jgi:hypothetical protein
LKRNAADGLFTKPSNPKTNCMVQNSNTPNLNRFRF